jgi:hypothetical protein
MRFFVEVSPAARAETGTCLAAEHPHRLGQVDGVTDGGLQIEDVVLVDVQHIRFGGEIDRLAGIEIDGREGLLLEVDLDRRPHRRETPSARFHECGGETAIDKEAAVGAGESD